MNVQVFFREMDTKQKATFFTYALLAGVGIAAALYFWKTRPSAPLALTGGETHLDERTCTKVSQTEPTPQIPVDSINKPTVVSTKLETQLQADQITTETCFTLEGVEWVVGHRESSAKDHIAEFVKKGESVDNWTELVTSRVYGSDQIRENVCGSPLGVSVMIQSLQNRITMKNSQGAWFKVVYREAREFLVEFFEPGTEATPPELNLYRAVLTHGGVYCFFYATRLVDQFAPESRNSWIDHLSHFRVFLE